MNKKILYYPQLATIDKKSKKLNINADSNVVIMNNIINSLSNEFDFYALMPTEKYCNTLFNNIISNKVKDIIELSYSNKSAFSLRYNFHFDEYYNILKKLKPDFNIINIPPLIKNIQTASYLLNFEMKIINFLHFLDLPEENKVPINVSYFLRQVEGVLSSDLSVFQSITVKDKTIKAINKYFNKKLLDRYIINSTVWNATYSQKDIDRYKKCAMSFNKKTILFPNRLSNTGYSNHKRFFEAIRNISKNRDDFQVIVNNPTRLLSCKEIKQVCPNLKIINNGKLLEKSDYFKMLHGVDIGVALFTQEGHGGVSSKEFQAAGCLPVFPKVNEYQYLMPKNYKGYCNVDLNNLEEALNYVLDICKTGVGEKLKNIGMKKVYERDSIEYNIEVIKKDLNRLFNL